MALPEDAEGEKSVRKQVSVRDVAREAGVSPATVSYILNDTPGLSFTPETRQRVLAAAEKLHYTGLRIQMKQESEQHGTLRTD